MISGVVAPNLFLSLRKEYYDNRGDNLTAMPSTVVFNSVSQVRLVVPLLGEMSYAWR